MSLDAEKLRLFLEQEGQTDLAATQGLIANEMRRRSLPLTIQEIQDEGNEIGDISLEKCREVRSKMLSFLTSYAPVGTVRGDMNSLAVAFNEVIGKDISGSVPLDYMIIPTVNSIYFISDNVPGLLDEAQGISPEVKSFFNRCIIGVYRDIQDRTVRGMRQASLLNIKNIGSQKGEFIAKAFKQ